MGIWLRYRQKYGPLNPMYRHDLAVGRQQAMLSGGRPTDYMPWPGSVEEPDRIATPEEIMAELTKHTTTRRRQ